ncbi:MAG: PIN domain-containing protein [Opitutaceae bacterium]
MPNTNAFSAYLSGKSPSLTARMQAEFAAGSLRLSVMVMAELEFGAEKARRQMGTTRFIRRVESLRGQLEMEPLGPQFPRHYAQVRNQLEAAGHKIGDRDTLIASHALLLGATLVTRNRREFSRIAGLQVENWETD